MDNLESFLIEEGMGRDELLEKSHEYWNQDLLVLFRRDNSIIGDEWITTLTGKSLGYSIGRGRFRILPFNELLIKIKELQKRDKFPIVPLGIREQLNMESIRSVKTEMLKLTEEPDRVYILNSEEKDVLQKFPKLLQNKGLSEFKIWYHNPLSYENLLVYLEQLNMNKFEKEIMASMIEVAVGKDLLRSITDQKVNYYDISNVILMIHFRDTEIEEFHTHEIILSKPILNFIHLRLVWGILNTLPLFDRMKQINNNYFKWILFSKIMNSATKLEYKEEDSKVWDYSALNPVPTKKVEPFELDDFKSLVDNIYSDLPNRDEKELRKLVQRGKNEVNKREKIVKNKIENILQKVFRQNKNYMILSSKIKDEKDTNQMYRILKYFYKIKNNKVLKKGILSLDSNDLKLLSNLGFRSRKLKEYDPLVEAQVFSLLSLIYLQDMYKNCFAFYNSDMATIFGTAGKILRSLLRIRDILLATEPNLYGNIMYYTWKSMIISGSKNEEKMPTLE